MSDTIARLDHARDRYMDHVAECPMRIAPCSLGRRGETDPVPGCDVGRRLLAYWQVAIDAYRCEVGI